MNEIFVNRYFDFGFVWVVFLYYRNGDLYKVKHVNAEEGEDYFEIWTEEDLNISLSHFHRVC